MERESCWLLAAMTALCGVEIATGQHFHLPPEKRQMNDTERLAVLKAINDFRSNVKPTAADMLAIEWDMNLERSALRLGALCGANHKWNEMVPEFPHIGFTRAGIEYAGQQFNFGDVMKLWTDEKRNYDTTAMHCKLGYQCSNYEQLVWSWTTHVGCAVRHCAHFVSSDYKVQHHVAVIACVYGDGSDAYSVRGDATLYETGPPCTKCPLGFFVCKNNLCYNMHDCKAITESDCTFTDRACACAVPPTLDADAAETRHGRRTSVRVLWTVGAALFAFTFTMSY